MKSKSKKLDQHLYHEIDDYKSVQKYLKKTAPTIGFIVHKFNTLEECVNLSICEWIHSGADTMGLIILNKLNYSSKVDLLNRICLEAQNALGKNMPSFDQFIINLREAGRLRNTVLHAEWENTDFEGFTHVRLKINKEGIFQEYIQFDENSLKKILAFIEEAINQFENYLDEKEGLFH